MFSRPLTKILLSSANPQSCFLLRPKMSSSTIASNLQHVLNRISLSASGGRQVRLVAVSKTKPADAVAAAYAAGQRHFGENYVKELLEKATNTSLLAECPDIRWHFIGNLQSNKVAKVVDIIPHLFVVETVDSTKLAELLDRACAKKKETSPSMTFSPLKVFVQVNTSGEAQKQGVEPEEAGDLADFIRARCAHLELCGFMTIGSFETSTSAGENPDFACLSKVRRVYCEHRAIDEATLELSMGMSHDFETAVRMGSTNVRVGSLIFGSR